VSNNLAADDTNEPIKFLVAAGEGLSLLVPEELASECGLVPATATVGGEWDEAAAAADDMAAAAALLLPGVSMGASDG